jgi:hypothetical protein
MPQYRPSLLMRGRPQYLRSCIVGPRVDGIRVVRLYRVPQRRGRKAQGAIRSLAVVGRRVVVLISVHTANCLCYVVIVVGDGDLGSMTTPAVVETIEVPRPL